MTPLRKTFLYAVAAIPAVTLYSCLDDSTIGNTIVEDEVAIIVDSTFSPTFTTVANPDVPARTITQLLGAVDAPGYGYLSSDVVTQFMPALSLDTAGVTSIDSLLLKLQLDATAFTGDSLAPMGLEVYPLEKQLVSPMNSSFDPAGYYDKDKLLGSTIYNMSLYGESDSVADLSYREVQVKLPRELGQQLYDAYVDNPANFNNPTAFTNNVFKGLYLHNSYGSGRIIRVAKTFMSLYFTRKTQLSTGKDTITHEIGNYFAVTPEVITNNNINYRMADRLKQDIADGDNIISAPAGTDVELVFPAREMIAKYCLNEKGLGVVNSIVMTVKASAITNEYDIAPPPHLLLILKSKRKDFFANNDVTDNKTSFYASYNETQKAYVFAGMTNYFTDLMEKETITDDDVTFVLTPVSISTETSSYSGSSVITAITPFVSWPTMCRIDPKDTFIKFTYTRQTLID